MHRNMRVYIFILFSFLFILLENSVHGSNDRMLRVRSAVERPRKRQGSQVRHQAGTISIEEMQEQFGQLGVHTAPNSSHHRETSRMPVPPAESTRHARNNDSASSSGTRNTVEDMDMQMQSLGFHGKNVNPQYETTGMSVSPPTSTQYGRTHGSPSSSSIRHQLKNPNAPPPLPSGHFDKICAGSIISVMTQGKTYIDVGILYENSTWPFWVFEDLPSEPHGPDRAWVSVSDPSMHRSPQKYQKKLSAGFRIYLPHMYHGPDNENPTSEVFITNGAYVYHASLLLIEPDRENNPSVVSVLSEVQSGVFRCLHGVLKVWRKGDHVPDWVLQRRPIWL